jgi:hypothetical protein
MASRPFKALSGGAPDSLKKRRLLNDKGLKKELCQRYGEQFLDLGWWEDALEFFRKADYEPGLDRLKALALETGDAYSLGRLGRHSPDVWRQAAEQALKSGKLHFAIRAFEQAGEQEKADNLARRLHESSAPDTS